MEDHVTSEEEYRKLLSQITTKVLDGFLNHKGVESECPMCQHSELVVPQVRYINERDSHDVTVRHAHYEEFIHSKDGFDPVNYCYHLICKNCGYIMKYNTAVVLNWHLSKDDNNEPS